MRIKILMVAEFDHTDPSSGDVRTQAEHQLDRFREAVQPHLEFGITLSQATGIDLQEFQSAGRRGPFIGHLAAKD